jgi:hypothetical protein
MEEATTGCDNVAIGQDALGDGILTGFKNIAIGCQSSKDLTSGTDNIALGRGSYKDATTGCYNIAIGTGTMGASVVTGLMNIGMGPNALDALTSGSCNIAMGDGALGAATTGVNNIALGAHALGSCIVTGATNIGIGCSSLSALTSGANNIVMGDDAANVLTTATNMISIGRCSGGAQVSGDNNIMIGTHSGFNPHENNTTASNRVTLGNHTTGAFNVSSALSNPSDERDKTDVSDLDLGLDYIKALRPVFYRWDKRGWYDEYVDSPPQTDEEKEEYATFNPDGSRKKNRWEIGLLAQEALAAEKLHTNKLQVKNEGEEEESNEGLTVDGTHYAGYRMQYQKIIMPLILSAQELDDKIAALAARVTTLED